MSLIRRIALKLLFIIMRIFKIQKNKIVFTSYYGKGFGDNGKYICKELLKSDKNFDIVWLTNDINQYFPNGIRTVKYKSLKSFYELATAKIWIDNSRKPDYILKRKKQYYIQTWHSSLRLKKIEADAINELPDDYIRIAKSDSKKMNLLTVGCKFSEDMYDRAFWYNGEKLCCGTPRCDLFFDKNELKKLREMFDKKYNTKGKKIILYAPTFKKTPNINDSSINFDSFIKKITKLSTDEYVLFIKLHPISKKHIKEQYQVFDFTKYPDIQELIAVCDIFITDYSGCCFDAMIANKPCLLYTPDLKDYLLKERSLCFDFDELPFNKSLTEDELISNIINFNFKEYSKKIKKFNKKIGTYEDGQACKKIVNKIKQIIEGDNK